LRQYFRYVGLGAVRVGATSANNTFAPVAFRNTNGKYVVVVKATAGGSFSVGGLPAGKYGIDYTVAGDYKHALPDVTVSGSQALTTSIPAAGVLTIFAK
ncbi:MAG: glycoside hydrolase family 30 beta sandwich domain-containing protein, partial [Gemmatimonadaceae bacterium]